MNKQTIQSIMGFMMQTQLTGHQVPEFNAAMNALQAELNREDNQSLQQVVDAVRNEAATENA